MMTPTRSAGRAIAAMAVALTGGLSVAASDAHAGDYTVPYCISLDGTPLNQFNDWEITSSNKPGTIIQTPCHSASGGFFFAFDGSSPQVAGDHVTARLNATGDGMSIVGVEGSGMYTPGDTDPSVAPITNLIRGCDGTGSCNTPRPWSGRWTVGEGGTPALPSIAMQLACNRAQCNGGMLHIQRLALTFRDSAAPQPGTISGALVSSKAGEPVNGAATVSVAGADTGSGVSHAEAVVDGAVVGRTSEQCAPPFTRQNPCPNRLQASLSVDTTKLSNGTHDLEVRLLDASGNAGTAWSGKLIVDNGAALGPGSDPNLRGAPAGSYGADDAVLKAWWPATGRAPSKKTSVRRACKRKSYARRHQLACKGRAPGRDLTTNWSARKTNLIRGQLRTPSGDPVVGARVQLVSTPVANGATSSAIAAVTTDERGAWVLKVPVSSGSAKYSAQWLAKARDNTATAAVDLRRAVRASTTIAVSARRIRRGKTLTIRGQLRSRDGVLEGNAIAIQAKPQNSWRAVTTVRTGADGRWTARYRIPTQLRGRYKFRATVQPAATYPYSRGASGSKIVTIR